MEGLKYKDDNGDIVTVFFDPTYPIKIDIGDENTQWSVEATDPSETEVTDFVGARPKR